jgi:hypothetical protein
MSDSQGEKHNKRGIMEEHLRSDLPHFPSALVFTVAEYTEQPRPQPTLTEIITRIDQSSIACAEQTNRSCKGNPLPGCLMVGLVMATILSVIFLFVGCSINPKVCVGLQSRTVTQHIIQDVKCQSSNVTDCSFQAGINSSEGCVFWFDDHRFDIQSNLSLLAYNITEWNQHPIGSSIQYKSGLRSCGLRLLPNTYDQNPALSGIILFPLCVCACCFCCFVIEKGGKELR